MTSRSKKSKSKRVRFDHASASVGNAYYSSDDEDNICRCVCGDNDFTAKRPWIQCTDCKAWQHNDCMNVSVFEEELEDHYWCEQCAEERHVELLGAIAKGERPWKGRNERTMLMKAEYEDKIKAVLESVDWLWQSYEPQYRAVAGDGDAIPRKQAAPASYVKAVKGGLQSLFDDSPMQSLRDLSDQLSLNDNMQRTIRLLRKKAARVYDEGDFHVLGILAQLFEWTEKGTLHDDFQ